MADRAAGVIGVIFVVTIYECGRESCGCVIFVVTIYECGRESCRCVRCYFVVTKYECGRESCGCVRCYFCGDDIRVWQRELRVSYLLFLW